MWSAKRNSRWYKLTGGHGKDNRRLPQLCELTKKTSSSQEFTYDRNSNNYYRFLSVMYENLVFSGQHYISTYDLFFLPYFSTFSHIRHDFPKKIIKHKTRCFIFSTNFSKIFLILWRIQRDIIIHLHWFSCIGPVILFIFKSNFNFLDRRLKNSHIANVMEIRLVGVQLFHSDRQTWWS